MATLQKISPCLWFDSNGEEAARFYVTLFPNSKVTHVTKYPKHAMRPEGTTLTVEFELAGQQFTALNGGPNFTFTEAISLMVQCDSQAEVDALWNALLSDGGRESECGWLKDRFGLSWQIIPREFTEMCRSEDTEAVSRAMQAMMKMVKLDLAKLRAAFEGRD